MAERLMGVETEYALSAMTEWRGGLDQTELLKKLFAMAQRRLVHLPDVHGGMYLGNGSRFYIDYGNHPELTTPECTNPWDVVRYILAGERVLADLTEELERELRGCKLMLFKSNVDYGGTFVTWGCHESYLHRASPSAMSDEIIPHLVTRIIYTGAGGFDSVSRGFEFTLSPRVPHLANVVSNNSTSDRGIFHTKDESLSKPGYHRLHIICGESLCSEAAMWLKAATTALVVAMVEAGLHPGHGVGLRSPLQAMQTIAMDQSCAKSVETSTGRRLSAIEIQYHYLSVAEKHAGDPCMPAWAEEVCCKWRAMLNSLLDAPESVASNLDWAIKRSVYEGYANSKGVAWNSLPQWTRVLQEVRQVVDVGGEYDQPLSAEHILNECSAMKPAMERLTEFTDRNGLSWDAIESVLKLREELFEIDTRFGQIGGQGIFASLDRAGVLKHHVPGVDNIEYAATHPPAAGRARVRGEVVRRLAGQNGYYKCDWQGVVDLVAKRLLDLSEPFESEERWLNLDEAQASSLSPFIELLSREGLRGDTTVRRSASNCLAR
ncbi:MAG: proteasome accessory factor PafA2 family protein [Acidobacteriota bacterium]